MSSIKDVSTNITILIDEKSALVGGIFVVLCAILGITVNSITMFVILARKRVRYHFTSPSLFYLSLSDFVFSAVCLPLQGNINLNFLLFPLSDITQKFLLLCLKKDIGEIFF